MPTPSNLRGPALLEHLVALPAPERDGCVDALLGIDALPPDEPNLPRGAVPYLPCGVEEILEVVRAVPLRGGDVFVDLGSGLGRVALLVHLLTGSRASGIEIQGSLVREARKRAAALGLEGIGFVQANAAEIDLEGTVFFLYAPFNGELLSRVVGRLEAVARRHAIVIAAVGLELGGVPWLAPRATSNPAVVLYDSRSVR
jgi:SAM-dependent methyltransferase